MNKFTFSTIAAVSALSLTACGGGGSSTANDSPVGVTGTQAIAAFGNLNNGFVAVSSNTTLQTDLPSTGAATYSGTMGFDVTGAIPGSTTASDASFVGDMTMDVDFATRQIVGSADNFIYADTDGALDRPSGTLTIAGDVATLPRTGQPDLEGVIAATASGQLAIDQGAGDQNVNFALGISGQFGGDSTPTANEQPLAARGFVVGSGSGDLTLNAPNGRFAVQRSGQTILP